MTFDIETIAKLASPIITLLLGAIVRHYTERRAKVISYLGHVSSFTLQNDQRTPVFTHSVIVRNAGKKAAQNVRLGHNILPRNMTILPKVQYRIEESPEGASEIVVPILVPKEQITISYLYFPPVTWDQVNTYTKFDEGLAKIINVIPMPQPPKWALILVWTLIFVGASLVLYWLMRLIAYVI
jgi:hypothetical protein